MCLHFRESAHAHGQNAPEWFSSTRAEAIERDLLVAFPVIDIRGMTWTLLTLKYGIHMLVFQLFIIKV